MPGIQEIRSKFPQYDDLSDQQLLDGLHSKFYSDIDRSEFEKRLGLSVEAPPVDANEKRQQAIKNVDEFTGAASEFLPGKTVQKSLDTLFPESVAKYAAPVTGLADEALKQYGNAAYGALRGLPVVGAYVDEATAGVGSVLGGDYDEILEHARAVDDVSERDYSAANLYGKVSGALSGGYGVGAKIVSKGAPLFSTIGKSALAGAGIGAAHEFGEGEDGFSNRMDRATDGAVFGGAIGGALPAIGAGVSKVAAPLIDKAAGTQLSQFGQSSDDAAEAILAKRLSGANGKGIDDVAADLARGQRSARLNSNSVAELPETIADTSDDAQRLLGSLYRTGKGDVSDDIYDTLRIRQEGAGDPLSRVKASGPQGQYKNIMDALERSLGIKTKKGSFAKTQDIVAKQATEGGQLYREAFKKADGFELTGELKETLAYASTQRGKIGKSLRKAAKYFTGDKNTTPVKNLKQFDDAKKALDDDIMRAKGNQKRELVAFKNRLLERVHGGYDEAGKPLKNIGYQTARDAWGGKAQAIEAIEMGKNALANETDDIVTQFKALSPGDKALFRVGLRDAFRKVLRTKTPGNDISRIFSENRVRELMAVVIPQSRRGGDVFGDRAARFGDFVGRQKRLNTTNKKVLGGSPTAQRTLDDKSLQGDVFEQALGSTRSLSATDAILGYAGKMIGKAAAIKQPVAQKMAKMLLEADPAQQKIILARLKRKLGNSRYNKFIQEWDRVMVGLGVSASVSDKQ